MTNIEKIRKMDIQELVTFLNTVQADPLYMYEDIEGWLLSDETTEKPAYRGVKGWLTNGMDEDAGAAEENSGRSAGREPCTVLRRVWVFGTPYLRVITDKDRLVTCPERNVEYDPRRLLDV